MKIKGSLNVISFGSHRNIRSRLVFLLTNVAGIIDDTVSLITLGTVVVKLRLVILFSDRVDNFIEGGK